MKANIHLIHPVKTGEDPRLRVLEALKKALVYFPHLRVGQLLDNAVFMTEVAGDLYSISDEDLKEALYAYMRALQRAGDEVAMDTYVVAGRN